MRCFAAERTESAGYSRFVDDLVRQQVKIKLAYTLYAPAVTGFNAALLAGVLVYGRRSVATPAEASDFAAFVFYTNRIQGAMSTISGQWAAFAAAMGAGEAVFELIDRKPAQPVEGGLRPGRGTGALRLEAVSFSYPGPRPPVLSAVSMEVRPGQRVALVGLSGSGKARPAPP